MRAGTNYSRSGTPDGRMKDVGKAAVAVTLLCFFTQIGHLCEYYVLPTVV